MKNLNHFDALAEHLKSIDLYKLDQIIRLIDKTIKNNNFVFGCGNGGSAAISNHFEVDYVKGVNEKSKKMSRFISLSSNTEVITAIANDRGYKHVFKDQFKVLAKSKDLILCVSSSGNSENIIEILKYGKQRRYKTILLSGFNGGRGKKISDYNIHINSNDYGIIEDCHHAIMHYIIGKLMKS
jgi:D-sedoheptulose 7-phosphate isomerase